MSFSKLYTRVCGERNQDLRIPEKQFDHYLVQEDGSNFFLPNPFLFSCRRRLTQALDVASNTGNKECYLGETESPTAVASKVEIARELRRMGFPISVGVTL